MRPKPGLEPILRRFLLCLILTIAKVYVAWDLIAGLSPVTNP